MSGNGLGEFKRLSAIVDGHTAAQQRTAQSQRPLTTHALGMCNSNAGQTGVFERHNRKKISQENDAIRDNVSVHVSKVTIGCGLPTPTIWG